MKVILVESDLIGRLETLVNRFTEWYLCSCPKCHISQMGSEYGFRFEAVDAWNRRVNDG